jgi:hypothetical protein
MNTAYKYFKVALNHMTEHVEIILRSTVLISGDMCVFDFFFQIADFIFLYEQSM